MNTPPVDLSSLPITYFLSGVAMACFAASGLFFLKFWRKTHETFFLFFAVACWFLAVERLPLLWHSIRENGMIYFFRFFAFVLIFIAVVRVNRNSHQKR